MDHPDERDSVTEYALELGTGIASASAGLVVAGPAGAITGALIGPTFSRVGRLLVDRFHHRDQERCLTALGHAAIVVADRLTQGEELRTDWFSSSSQSDGRSDGEEIAEAVLNAAATDPEERKLPFYGALLGNLAFHPDIDRFDANRLVRVANSLTYRQYLVLAVAATESLRPPYDGVELEWAGDDSPVDTTWALLQHECRELADMRLLAPEPGRHNNRVLTRAGREVVGLMGLEHVDEPDRVSVRSALIEKAKQPPLPDD